MIPILLLCGVILILLLNPFNKGPKSRYIIYQGYFRCDKCRSLAGGIFGKGPVKDLPGRNARFCIHKWIKIEKTEFMDLAEEWHRIDWPGESAAFWHSPEEE